MSAEDITTGDVCRCRHGLLGVVTGKVRRSDGNRELPPKYLGIRLSDGGQWQSVDPTFICHARDLEVPVKSTVQPEPRGDAAAERIPAILNLLRLEWEESPDLRLGQLLANLARNLNVTDVSYLSDDVLRAALEAEHPPRNLPA